MNCRNVTISVESFRVDRIWRNIGLDESKFCEPEASFLWDQKSWWDSSHSGNNSAQKYLGPQILKNILQAKYLFQFLNKRLFFIQSVNNLESLGEFSLYLSMNQIWGFPGGTLVKNPPANTGGTRDTGSIPGSGRSSGVGNGCWLQYSCLENATLRGAWPAIVHRVTKGQMQLSGHTHQSV